MRQNGLISINDIEDGECFIYSPFGEVMLKTSSRRGPSVILAVCLDTGGITHFNVTAKVKPIDATYKINN